MRKYWKIGQTVVMKQRVQTEEHTDQPHFTCDQPFCTFFYPSPLFIPPFSTFYCKTLMGLLSFKEPSNQLSLGPFGSHLISCKIHPSWKWHL